MSQSVGAKAVAGLIAWASQDPEAPVAIERREASVVVTPTAPETFAVSIYDEGAEAMVGAERWHAHYDDPAQAAFAAIWLLTPYYRIVHELKAGNLIATWLERWEAEGWMPFEPSYYLNPEVDEDWQPIKEGYARRYLQQAVLPPPRPWSEFEPDAPLDESGLPVDSHLGVRTEIVDEPLGHTLY